MRYLSLLVVVLSSPAWAGGAPADGINWFVIGDKHSLAMGWFIINFLLFCLGAFFVIKGPIMRQVRARADHFEALLRAADEAREAAERRQAELQARLDGLSEEIQGLRETTMAKLDHEKELILASAQSEISRAQKAAEIALERQRRAAERQLTQEAARLAFDAAKARVADALEDGDHSRLNADFVRTLEGEA
jgi:F0F1-type ATP synthase membrane subunit b/b'